MTQKIAICGPSHNFVGLHLRNESTYRQSDKNLISSNVSSTSHNMVNFGPLAAEIGSVVWGTPANFNRFRVLASLLQRHRSPEADQTLNDVWPSPALVHDIYILGGSCPWRNFARCKSYVLLYWQRYCTAQYLQDSAVYNSLRLINVTLVLLATLFFLNYLHSIIINVVIFNICVSHYYVLYVLLHIVTYCYYAISCISLLHVGLRLICAMKRLTYLLSYRNN